MMYRPDIDGLRAVAVLPVVLYHAGVPGPSGGFLGVDVFFVISGYLITAIVSREIDEGNFSLLSFYERRARRILPALMAVVAFCFAVGWFVLLPYEMERLGHSALATAIFLSNVYFALTLDYFARAAEYAPLLHTWSLAVEEQFYLFFPPLLMFLAAWSGRLAALWAVIVLSLLSFVAAEVFLPHHPDWVFYIIVFRAWELGAGAVLAMAATKAPPGRSLRETLSLVGLLAILVPVFVYDTTTPFPGLAALPPVLGTTILIWVGSTGGGSFVNSALAWRSFVWIGLISYSLYLWHWPLLAFLRIIFNTTTLPMYVGISAVATSFIAAWLSYKFVERPFRRRPPHGIERRTIFLSSMLAIMTTVTIGGTLHLTEGLPARLPPSVIKLADAAYDRNERGTECLRNTSDKEGLCRIGTHVTQDAANEFLLWGDSHANANMPGVELAAGKAGQSGYFAWKYACPPILAMQRLTNGSSCSVFNEDVLSWLEDKPNVSLVILSARWPLSVEGTRYRNEAGIDVHLMWTGEPSTDPAQAGSQDDINKVIFDAALRDTVSKILSLGKDVVLLGSVPEIGLDVPAVAARAELMSWENEALLSARQFASRASQTENLLAEIASDYTGVRYVPLHDLFCDAVACRTISKDGHPIYADDDHITQTAAKQLLPSRLRSIWP